MAGVNFVVVVVFWFVSGDGVVVIVVGVVVVVMVFGDISRSSYAAPRLSGSTLLKKSDPTLSLPAM